MSRGRAVVVCGALSLSLAVLGAWWATGPAAARGATARPGTASRAPRTSAARRPTEDAGLAAGTATPPRELGPGETLVATVAWTGAPGSARPGGRPTLEVPGEWLGAASVLPVVAERSGWVEVRRAQRPNGSVAWVRDRDVRFAVDPYRIVVDLATTHLELLRYGREVFDFPAGVGTPSFPTPTGQFFVAFFAASPTPAYGAFVIVTSAHSDTISDWEASGDAITAIHGPLGSDAAIGTTGARVSHGCIRLHNADLRRLRDVPAGTPVDIVG